MKMNDFFEFESKLLSSTFQASPNGLKDDENGVSEHLNLIKGKYEGINFPIVFKQESGKKLTDILDTGFAGFFLISDNLKTILEENHFIGWQTFPIKLYDRKEKEINGYHGFSITGTSGPVSYKDSDIIEIRTVPEGPICRLYKGLYIGIETWDNNDFFTPMESYMTIVPKKVADILIKNKISNMRLNNLAEIEIPVHIIKDHNRS